jgi:hypothetical protein
MPGSIDLLVIIITLKAEENFHINAILLLHIL